MTRAALRFPLAVALALPAVAGAALAQAPGTAPLEARWFETPDGSRFLLAPDPAAAAGAPGTTPLVHWAVVTPSGPAEDPQGLDGLSRAVVRASLNGTVARGSIDWRAELDALRALDTLEVELAARRGDGDGPDADGMPALLQRTEAARRTAAALADRLAWRRAVLDAPAVDLELRDTPRATVLAITTRADALPRIARALWDRRENAVLRGLREEFAACRAKLATRGHESWREAARREVLGLAFLGEPGARSPAERPAGFTRGDAVALWRAIVQPARTTHVLTGSFHRDEVERLLTVAFGATTLPRVPPPSAPTPGRAQARRSRITTDGPIGAAVGIPLPDGLRTEQIESIARWLAGGDTSQLAVGLRARGFVDPSVDFVLPFPQTARPGLLLVEFLAPELRSAAGAADVTPATALTEVVDAALAEAPPAWRLRAAQLAAQSERNAALVDPAALSWLLVRACAIEGRAPDEVLAPLPELEPDAARALALSLWRRPGRTIVDLVP
ncbi:MAG: hypothetical protein IPM29_26155 [Planctomycetes bacterium]|nr:hypothetical protein [Planctomycetota bacterium]